MASKPAKEADGQDLTLDERCRAVDCLLEAISFLHNKGHVHIDLKSTNIFVEDLSGPSPQPAGHGKSISLPPGNASFLSIVFTFAV